MFYFLKFVSLALLLNYCAPINAAEIDTEGAGPRVKRSKPTEPSFELNLDNTFKIDFGDLDSDHKIQVSSFDKKVEELREAIKESDEGSKSSHVVVFDCHGVLTAQPTPQKNETFNKPLVDLYSELLDSGATVIVSSAWKEMQRVQQSIKIVRDNYILTLKNDEEIRELSEKFDCDKAITTEVINGYEIVHAGNLVSARKEKRSYLNSSSYNEKCAAAIWYASQKGIRNIQTLTLFDDNWANTDYFKSQEPGVTFGVNHPKPKGILVPPNIDSSCSTFTLELLSTLPIKL